jgi:hypothetical protein
VSIDVPEQALSWSPAREAWLTAVTQAFGGVEQAPEEADPGEPIDFLAPGDTTGEFGIEYTSEELLVIADLVAAPGFPGVDTSPFEEMSDEVREAVLESAARCLVARRVLRIKDEDVTVDIEQPHAGLLALPIASQVVIRAERTADGDSENRSIYLDADGGAIHSSPIPGIHRLAFIDPGHVVNHVFRFLELSPVEAAQAEAFTLSRSALETAEAAVIDGDLEAARTALGDGGGPYLEAMQARRGSCWLSCLREDGDMVIGGELVWLDAGDRGIWVVEPAEQADPPESGDDADDEDPLMKIYPVEPRWLVEQFLDYLPSEETPAAAKVAADAAQSGDATNGASGLSS